MKRKLIAFSTTLALLLSVFSAAIVGAHTVTIEAPNLTASRADWFGLQSDGSGIGIVQRNSSQQGEYIFNDTSKDQRLITTTEPVTRETDLDYFGVTGDANAIYFLAKVENYGGISNNPSLELLITIDNNQSGGTVDLPLVQASSTYSTTKVTSDAAWEFAVRTTFPSGTPGLKAVNGTTHIHTTAAAGNGSTCPSSPPSLLTCNAQLAGSSVFQGSFAEIKVPWSQIGGKPADGKFLRMTVSTLYDDHTKIPNDGYKSPVIDVLGTGSTLDDLQDGTLDTSIDVHFASSGEVYAPLQITEFQPNPLGSDTPNNPYPVNPSTETEWIEIYNPNTFQVNLSDYKLSNTPKRNASSTSQGAVKFKTNNQANCPTGIIAANGVVIVAREKVRFVAGHPTVPSTSVYDLNDDMSAFTAWAGGVVQLDNGPNIAGGTFEEQVVLLDAKDDIVDMATYGNTTTPYPGHTPIPTSAVPEGVSYERCPVARDTNNNAVDFIVHGTLGEQTPGVICVGVPGLDLTVAKSAPSNPLKDEASSARYVPYTITYSNIGNQSETSAVTLVDTLPTGLTFSSASVTPAVNGKVLTWSFPTGLPAGAIGTIVMTATVDSGVGENVALVNNVTINGPSELELAKANNSAQATTVTLGPPDTSVSSNLSGPVPPGAQFQFTISYHNLGADDATGVTITNVLPTGVTILSVDSPNATWDGATTGPVTWDVGTLPANPNPGSSGTIVVTAQLSSSAAAGTTLTNALSITAPANDPNSSNNSETKILTVGQRKVYLPATLR